jgi:lantibiotic modifying enzyme
MDKTINTTNTDQYLDVAYAIGTHLAKTALWDRNRCTWIGSSVEAINDSFQLVEKSFTADLYSGTSGVALFLSLLLEHQPDVVLQETLEGIINHILSMDTASGARNNYGYFGGDLGVASTLITAGEKMNRKDWEKKGWDRLLDLCKKPVQEFEVDVISGVAGAIPILISYFTKSRNKEIGEAIIRCSNFLIEKAIKKESFWSWRSLESQPEMTGYSHGASGISSALLEVYKITGEPTYFTGAMMGFNFERVHFNSQIQNWPDLREFPTASQPQTLNPQLNYGESWCHGAPGIALSRLRAWQITNDPSFKQEAEIALATTHRNIYNAVTNPATPSNFSICHGLAGNADILLEGGTILNNAQYTQVAKEVGNYGVEKYYKNKITWPSGVNDPSGATPGMGETPGLMLGLAGTGYFYLRLAFPQKIKSVLLL